MQCGESYFEEVEVDAIQHLTQTIQQRSVKMSRKSQGIDWLAENMNALEAYNRRIELNGVFSDGQRRF
jgi:antitoxin CcdA